MSEILNLSDEELSDFIGTQAGVVKYLKALVDSDISPEERKQKMNRLKEMRKNASSESFQPGYHSNMRITGGS